MKRTLSIMIICALCLLPLTSCSLVESKNNSEFQYIGGTGDYIHYLFSNYEFIRTSTVAGEFQKRIDETNTLCLVGSAYYYKYSHDGNRYIAMHAMELSLQDSESKLQRRKINGSEYLVIEDMFQLYDTESEKLTKFETYEEFQAWISEMNINLNNWYYPSAGNSLQEKNIININDYSIIHIGFPRGCKLIKGGFDVMQGETTKYAVVENDMLLFDFRNNNVLYDNEFISTSNIENDMTTKWVSLNTETGDFEKFDSEKALFASLNLDENNFQGWNVIDKRYR